MNLSSTLIYERPSATTPRATARGWLRRLGHGLDGIVAKRLGLPYRPGERAMPKYKLWQTVDCVQMGSTTTLAG